MCIGMHIHTVVIHVHGCATCMDGCICVPVYVRIRVCVKEMQAISTNTS
jgi:hypothetical protein